MYKEILIKYLNNDCSNEEFEMLVAWLKKERENTEDKNWILEDWRAFEPEISKVNTQKYSALLDKIHHEINLKKQKKEKSINIRRISKWLSQVAAILFVPLLVFFCT